MGLIVIAQKNVKVCTVQPTTQKRKRMIIDKNDRKKINEYWAESIRTFSGYTLDTYRQIKKEEEDNV
tara:strand:- start:257 stop:457 length:201 start_codon:yes stop_codon:yes gene_type:complete